MSPMSTQKGLMCADTDNPKTAKFGQSFPLQWYMGTKVAAIICYTSLHNSPLYMYTCSQIIRLVVCSL